MSDIPEPGQGRVRSSNRQKCIIALCVILIIGYLFWLLMKIQSTLAGALP